jgi:hypothetical protein
MPVLSRTEGRAHDKSLAPFEPAELRGRPARRPCLLRAYARLRARVAANFANFRIGRR